jgi:hypothetical protein
MKFFPFLAVYLSATFVLADEDIHQQVTLKGKWLVETNEKVMLDPQTSALKLWRGKLLSLSDRSAHESQQKQLHIIDSSNAIVSEKSLVMTLSKNIQESCFYQYLANKPDFEALAIDPDNDNVFFIVTEDAREGVQLSHECQQRFKETGSTKYPSLLVRLEIDKNNILSMTHVRPLQFSASYDIGDFANDGIEGLAFGKNNTLYLGLEKDNKGLARIFSLSLTDKFWESEEFAPVVDTEVVLPAFKEGRHPINGMDYIPVDNHPGFIAAAARNDNQLWIIDLANKKPTNVILLKFLAPVISNDKQCKDWELIGNTSLEGVAVANDNIWLINDPWKAHYMENVKCESNRDKYKNLSPLLFSLPISKQWFE